jgi:putative alpha-1,2-mannosidase
MMLSFGASQKLITISFAGAMALIFSLAYLFGGVAVSASASYHDDAGVLRYVNPKIGTYGVTPNGNGGMIPSVSEPFGMTRWTPQTREVRNVYCGGQ